MARPKTLRAEPVSKSTQDLLMKMRAAIKAAGFEDKDGWPLDGNDFDPVVELSLMSKDPRLKPADRLMAAKECARYVHSQLGNVQVTGQVQHSHVLVRHEDSNETYINDMRGGQIADKEQLEDPNAIRVVISKFG
jgi:hypothetical protein